MNERFLTKSKQSEALVQSNCAELGEGAVHEEVIRSKLAELGKLANEPRC